MLYKDKSSFHWQITWRKGEELTCIGKYDGNGPVYLVVACNWVDPKRVNAGFQRVIFDSDESVVVIPVNIDESLG